MTTRKNITPDLIWLMPLTALLLLLALRPFPSLVQRQRGMVALVQATLPATWTDASARPRPIALDAPALTAAESSLQTAVVAQSTERALALVALAQDDPATARRWLEARLAAAPDDALARFLLGESYLVQEEWRAAVAAWVQAEAQGQLLKLAQHFIAAERPQAAQMTLEALLPLTWDDDAVAMRVEVHKLLADVALAQADAQQAIAHYEAVVQLRPDNAYAYGRLGDIFFGEGAYAAALAHFEQAYALDFARPRWILVKIARSHAALHQWSEAAAALRKALKAAPEDVDAHALLVEALCESGNGDEARRFFRRLNQDTRPAAHAAAERLLRTYATCLRNRQALTS